MSAAVTHNRNRGLDLLRAVSMLFVIFLHLLGQGGVAAAAAAGNGKFYVLRFLQILSYCAVDVYGIITGYLMCTKSFRLSRVVKLWVTTVFWSVCVTFACFWLFPESRSVKELISAFFPLLRGRYWFFTAYFVVMLVSPVLNVTIRALSRQQFRLLFAALFLIFGILPVGALGQDVLQISAGLHFSWMMALYLIGGYLRIHGTEGSGKNRKRWLLGYLLTALMQLGYVALVRAVGLANFDMLLLTYPSPLVLMEAICLFQYFRETGQKISGDSLLGRSIAWITPGVYSVYIIHVHPQVFWNATIIGCFRAWDNWGTLRVVTAVVLTALAVFGACILLDWLRQRLFRLVGADRAVEKAADRIEETIRTLVKE